MKNLLKRKNILKFIFILLISLLIPNISFGLSATTSYETFPFAIAIGMELFISIHMTVFVILPLADIFDSDKKNNLAKKLFFIRVFYLLVFDLFVSTYIAIFDFISVFVGAFLVVPFCSATFSKKDNLSDAQNLNSNNNFHGISYSKSITNTDIDEDLDDNKLYNMNCSKLKSYYKLSDSDLDYLIAFINDNPNNTIIAEKDLFTLTGPIIHKKTIKVEKIKPNRLTIIVTNNQFTVFDNSLVSPSLNSNDSDEDDVDPIKNF